jgi:hypothetical protein
VHAKDGLILDREIDVSQGDLGRIVVQLKATGAPGAGFDEFRFSKFRHQAADHHGIGVHTFSNKRRGHGSLAQEPGRNAHGVNGDNEAAAGQHVGNSKSYIFMMGQKVKRTSGDGL